MDSQNCQHMLHFATELCYYNYNAKNKIDKKLNQFVFYYFLTLEHMQQNRISAY